MSVLNFILQRLTTTVAVLFLCLYTTAQINAFSKYASNADKPAAPYDPSSPYYVVEFNKGIPSHIEAVRQFDPRTAIVRVRNSEALSYIQRQARFARANDEWKFSPQASGVGEKNVIKNFMLSTTPFADLDLLLHDKKDFQVISHDKPSHTFIVRTTEKLIREYLLPLKEVTFIDLRQEPQTEVSIIGYNRSFHGLSAVDYSIPGANGRGIVAGVKEQKMEELDLDLHKRVLPSALEANTISNHATVISAIIGGAGNSFYDGRGIAYQCSFFPSSFANLFPDDASVLNTNLVSVQNHSYGTVIQQFYGTEAMSYDRQTWENKNIIHVFSAGNQGMSSATEGAYSGLPGFANLTGNFKMAKNIITIGAIDNKGNVSAESSSGPAYDGRVAPQLVALGPNGTSDAAAIVTGTVAVMQQVYADSNNHNLPPASLVKALLYNNAIDIGMANVDYKTGFGLVDSYASIKALQQKKYESGTVSQDQEWEKNIIVPAECAQIKVTLCWTDSASLPNNHKALLNDLDLEVEENTGGVIYRPWVLSTSAHADSLLKTATRKRDSLNTAEQVTIDLPVAGTYTIRVRGNSIPGTAIPFHVAFTLDTLDRFYFLSPQHTSDVNREENHVLDIRWKTFVADTNTTGNLFISYDAGHDWKLVKANYKIYTNNFQWPIKDTNSRAWLKMETGFGQYFSNQFMISKVTRLNVDFLCADSFRLSWNRHIDAGGYTLFTLTDSPYLKPVMTVTDTFVTLSRADHPSLVYAVRPDLINGIQAARSVAQDISLQGVHCFYRSFYYNLLNDNKLELILELSSPNDVDSIFFDQVNSVGQLEKALGGIRATGQTSIYDFVVNDLRSGTTYWRARIRLRSGGEVLSETISITTSGRTQVLLYPNPVRAGETLNFVWKQGTAADSRLLFYDVYGRLLKEIPELQGTIDITTLPPGVLIYKLVTREGQLLQAGKLVILR